MAKEKNLSPETINAQALHHIDALTGGLTPAIYPSSTYVRDENYQLINAQHSYGRDENPSYAVAEDVLAELEGAPAALLFSSGMAAAMAVVQVLQPGDQIVAPRVMYWGLRKWLTRFCDQWGLELALFDAADPDALANTVKKGKMELTLSRNPRYDILFEPVKIGPVTSRNRFYQVPHNLGVGNQMPHTLAGMREVRAEGGWGVVNTGYCSIHPSSDDSPFPYSRLWDDEDIKVHSLMVDAVHRRSPPVNRRPVFAK